MVVVSAFAMLATFPGRTHGLGIVTERLLLDDRFDFSRREFGDLNFWATLLGATFCIPCGRLLDRYGVRKVLSCTVALLGATVLSMTALDHRTGFFMALVLTRGFGQSALSVVSITHVGKWFGRRSSGALGVYSVLVSLGFGLTFRIAGRYREAEWTTVWGAVGAILLASVPVFWLATRDSPGTSDSTEPIPTDDSPVIQDDDGHTLSQALRTGAFWVFGLATALYGLITSGTTLFHESILAERGFDTETFYTLGSFMPLVGLAANLVGGILLSRIPPGRFMAISMGLVAVSLVSLPFVTTRAGVYSYGVGMGIAGGLTTVLFFSLWGKLYGGRHLGRIQGAAQMLTVIASAIGPALLARCHAATGSYWPVYWLLAGAATILAVAALVVPSPQPVRAPATPA
ncbi:MAG: MFS transporter [Planctomycetota bacterium]|nr:MFS transporter [Planctomycetota bacterium]